MKPENAAPILLLPNTPRELNRAVLQLAKSDALMRSVIQQIGPCQLTVAKPRTPFQSLVRAIAHQQLHGRAAQTILQRFAALAKSGSFPTPTEVLQLGEAPLRAVGLSQAKTLAVLDLAGYVVRREIPSWQRMKSMSDEDIIASLSRVRGIGRWTVEMVLIFQLGRADVLALDDYGVRNGLRKALGDEALPDKRTLAQIGEAWRPWRSIACWYLWRMSER